jgi:hypothetical protein
MRFEQRNGYSALGLLDQTHVVNLHFFVHGFAHIVDRKQREGDTNERFHLDSGLPNCLRRAFHLNALVGSDNVDLNFAERQSMAKRDEVRRLFRSLDASDLSSGEHIAFRDLILRD